MKNSIKLNSQEWCDVVFDNKNKSYGAYEMRMSSSKRHIVAFLVTIGIAILIALIPVVLSKASTADREHIEGMSVDLIMSDIKLDDPIEEIIEMVVPEPPKPILNSIQFTPPVIGTEEEVPDDLAVNTVDDVLNDSRTIGYLDVDTGTDDLDLGAELARIEEERIIVEAAPTVFQIAEVMPQFPGGEADMMNFIGKNLKYPIVDQESGTQGRVTVRFVVTKTGDIDQVEVLRGISPSADREAIRVVKSMPKWIPGKQNGKPVAVYFTLPIKYTLK